MKLLDARRSALAVEVLAESLVVAFAAIPEAGYHLVKKYELEAAPTAEQPHPQSTPVSGTFRLMVYGR